MNEFAGLFSDVWTVEYITENRFGDEYVKGIEVEDEEAARVLAENLIASHEECVTIRCNGEMVEV